VVRKTKTAKRISDTKKEKETTRKAKNARRTTEKTEKKKKRTIAAKAVEKTTASKTKAGEKKVRKVKTEGKRSTSEKKKVLRNREKREESKAKRESEKKIAKTEDLETKKTGRVVAATRRMKKAGENAPLKRGKKVTPKSTGRIRISKAIVPKTARKIKVKTVSEITEEEKISEQIVKKKVVPSAVKRVVAGRPIGSGKGEKPRKIVRGAGPDQAVKVKEAKETAGVQEHKVQKEVREKEVRMWAPQAVLPEEYGENYVSLVTVDPYRLFAFWEVREETLEIFRGEVDIRVYDVTDVDFDMVDANSYLDVKVDARIGKCYISVSPEREYLADVGIIFDGIFISIARSARVSTPRGTVLREGILPYVVWEIGLRTGY
jgi:hypothetical protein